MGKEPKYKGSENKGYIEAMREKRRSNASGTHADRRYRRKRTRKEMNDAEVYEQYEGDFEQEETDEQD